MKTQLLIAILAKFGGCGYVVKEIDREEMKRCESSQPFRDRINATAWHGCWQVRVNDNCSRANLVFLISLSPPRIFPVFNSHYSSLPFFPQFLHFSPINNNFFPPTNFDLFTLFYILFTHN